MKAQRAEASNDPVSQDADGWRSTRRARTRQAIDEGDLRALRTISALPGGFGGDELRKKAWCTLLHTHKLGTAQGHLSSGSKDSEGPLHSHDHQDGDQPEAESSKAKPHPNERQVGLDTNRAFVTYPKGIPHQRKLELQEDLNDLIVGVLRKYPALSYFQGYHDILSVLYLTFVPVAITRTKDQPTHTNRRDSFRTRRSNDVETKDDLGPDLGSEDDLDLVGNGSDIEVDHEKSSPNRHVPEESLDDQVTPPPPYSPDFYRDTEDWRELRRCAEMVSLNRVRDAMGSGMEGMMGLLRILKRILRAADPELSKFSAQISPVPTLPFFALSWVLTLFSHDCDSLQPVQRMFDYLLARNPISAVYLAAGILIAKKPQMLGLARQLGDEYQEDPTLLHPLFVRLPPLYDDKPFDPDPSAFHTAAPTATSHVEDDSPNPYKPIKLSELFQLTDSLMEEYPWDGDAIRGREILGEGSAVVSYPAEKDDEWTPEQALAKIDTDVMRPGAGTAVDDEDEDEELPTSPVPVRKGPSLRIPRRKLNTLVAVGIVVLGVGIATYGVRAGGRDASWGGWWRAVIRSWMGREGGQVRGRVASWLLHARRAVKDIL
ncbi:hypothetical protein IAU60_006220 [Kwoniella sp. DSM 27419]